MFTFCEYTMNSFITHMKHFFIDFGHFQMNDVHLKIYDLTAVLLHGDTFTNTRPKVFEDMQNIFQMHLEHFF